MTAEALGADELVQRPEQKRVVHGHGQLRNTQPHQRDRGLYRAHFIWHVTLQLEKTISQS